MVFEEEDFQSTVYGYTLFQDVNDLKVCALLKEAEEDLIKRAKTINDDSDEFYGVTNRIKFLRFLLQSLISLWPSDVTEF